MPPIRSVKKVTEHLRATKDPDKGQDVRLGGFNVSGPASDEARQAIALERIAAAVELIAKTLSERP